MLNSDIHGGTLSYMYTGMTLYSFKSVKDLHCSSKANGLYSTKDISPWYRKYTITTITLFKDIHPWDRKDWHCGLHDYMYIHVPVLLNMYTTIFGRAWYQLVISFVRVAHELLNNFRSKQSSKAKTVLVTRQQRLFTCPLKILTTPKSETKRVFIK